MDGTKIYSFVAAGRFFLWHQSGLGGIFPPLLSGFSRVKPLWRSRSGVMPHVLAQKEHRFSGVPVFARLAGMWQKMSSSPFQPALPVGRFWPTYCVLVAVALGVGDLATAAPPWSSLFAPSNVEADPNKTYPLRQEHGPWMILASTFCGPNAEAQANELALELRKRYKLNAYVHKVRLDLKDAPGRGVDRFGRPLKMRYQRGTEIEEYAVLVGHFQTVDDPEAQKTLQKIKRAQPACLQPKDGKSTSQSLAEWRLWQERLAKGEKTKGPMGHAMITANPLLPTDYFNPKGVDEFVLDINRDVPYSLLDCPGRYTVQVARFSGHVSFDPEKIRAAKSGQEIQSKLAEAGEKAEKLTEALRLKGYEAYTFHERYASIVTVGSFDSLGFQGPDGSFVPNPKVKAIIERFEAKPINIPGQPPGLRKPEQLVGLFFDACPTPIEVPRRSISAAYSRPMMQPR
jgi:hypothetical protein